MYKPPKKLTRKQLEKQIKKQAREMLRNLHNNIDKAAFRLTDRTSFDAETYPEYYEEGTYLAAKAILCWLFKKGPYSPPDKSTKEKFEKIALLFL